MRRFTKFARAGPTVSLRSVSRRHFFGISAGAAGGVLGSGLWTPALGDHDDHDDGDRDDGRETQQCPEQQPIPHVNSGPPAGFGAFHFFFPGRVDGVHATTDPEPDAAHASGRDPSMIFDFDGVVGEADLNLTGTGTDTTTGVSAMYGFHTDMRFMRGRFVGTDGRVHHGTFAFI